MQRPRKTEAKGLITLGLSRYIWFPLRQGNRAGSFAVKTTILGGVLFLAPLVIVTIILGKAFQFSLLVADALSSVVDPEGVLGVLAINLVALVLIIAFCYGAGLLAQRAFLSERVQRLEGFLIDLIPGYAIFRVVVTSASATEEVEGMMKPVMVRFDDYDQIAFEIEKGETQSVLYLPGCPSAWSGSSVVAAADRITPLDIPAHQAVKLMRVFGRGSLDLPSQAAQISQSAD